MKLIQTYQLRVICIYRILGEKGEICEQHEVFVTHFTSKILNIFGFMNIYHMKPKGFYINGGFELVIEDICYVFYFVILNSHKHFSQHWFLHLS
jgi:hypothetical protein